MNLFLYISESKYSDILVKGFLALSVVYFFSSIFFGLDFTDSFYHLNQALYPANDIYLYPFFLSSVIIKGIIHFLGPEIIYLRFFNSLLLLFSILLPFLFVKVPRPRKEILLYIGIALILFAPFNVNILGYDSLSIFFLSLIFSFSVLYFHRPTSYLLLLLALLCSAAVMIRLPNVLAVPIVLLVIGFGAKIQRGSFYWKRAVLFLGSTALFVFLGYSLYYSSFRKFFEATANSSSHDFKTLFYNYFLHGLRILLFLGMFLGTYLVYKKLAKKFSELVSYGPVGLFFIFIIGMLVFGSKYSQNYSLFLTSLALSILIVLIFRNRKELLTIQNLVLYVYVLFLFINPFGSNTGLLKAVSLFLLLPFVLSYQTQKTDKYWLLILIVLIPFSIVEKLYRTYEDSSISIVNTTVSNPTLYPIKTTKTRAEFLKNVDSEKRDLEKNNVKVYFYGDKSHIFHYLYPETGMNISSFFQPVDELSFYSHIEQKFKENKKVAIFLIDSYPGNEARGPYPLEEKLIGDGFKKEEKALFTYYLKIEKY